MGRPKIDDQTKLATALSTLHGVAGAEGGVVKGSQLPNAERALLVKSGFLREILRGWYFVADPLAEPGDTTPFYANFWDYLAAYLEDRFGADYRLNAEQSVMCHACCTTVPRQVSVLVGRKMSQMQSLIHGHSIAMYPDTEKSGASVLVRGVRCMPLPESLVKTPPRTYRQNSKEIQIALATLADPAAVAALTDTNTAGVARVVAALDAIGRRSFAEEVRRQLAGVGIVLPRVENPFDHQPPVVFGNREASPLAARIHYLWARHREAVLSHRPDLPDEAMSPESFRKTIEAAKLDDTYHSLSIERYRVTPELIQRVASGQWDTTAQQQEVAAMAARGYLDAFTLVRDASVIAYANRKQPAKMLASTYKHEHQRWFQALFNPSVTAGILKASDLFGYRRHLVFLKGSLHTPPNFEHVLDGMDALLQCFEAEPDAFVRAVLGHWLFGFIHPYMDGNGRMARFVMNYMLASGGYPWTIIRVEAREAYMAALEAASVNDDIVPFARLIRDSVNVAVRS